MLTLKGNPRLSHGAIGFLSLVLCILLGFSVVHGADPMTITIWPGTPPDETLELPPEADITTEQSAKVEGRRVMRIGNVSQPTLTVFRPAPEKDTGVAVLICPGGGHHILAYDLEGTEVASWLNTLGVTGIILKYRVPARHKEPLWRSAVQDAQRSMRLIRSRAENLHIDPKRIGILGFSAGGQTAVMTSLLHEQDHYAEVDSMDQASGRPDFAILVYPAWLVDEKSGVLRDEVRVGTGSPPMFFAHAMDDPISAENSILLGTALKRVGVGAEMHLYDGGGHGFGLRPSKFPCSTWPTSCEKWMRQRASLP